MCLPNASRVSSNNGAVKTAPVTIRTRSALKDPICTECSLSVLGSLQYVRRLTWFNASSLHFSKEAGADSQERHSSHEKNEESSSLYSFSTDPSSFTNLRNIFRSGWKGDPSYNMVRLPHARTVRAEIHIIHPVYLQSDLGVFPDDRILTVVY